MFVCLFVVIFFSYQVRLLRILPRSWAFDRVEGVICGAGETAKFKDKIRSRDQRSNLEVLILHGGSLCEALHECLVLLDVFVRKMLPSDKNE